MECSPPACRRRDALRCLRQHTAARIGRKSPAPGKAGCQSHGYRTYKPHDRLTLGLQIPSEKVFGVGLEGPNTSEEAPGALRLCFLFAFILHLFFVNDS